MRPGITFNEEHKDKSSSICYMKFSGKGPDFDESKIKTLVLTRGQKFIVYLKENGTRSLESEARLNYEKIADIWDWY